MAIVFEIVYLQRNRTKPRYSVVSLVLFRPNFLFAFSEPDSQGASTDIEKVTKCSRGMATAFDILQTERRFPKRFMRDY